MKRDIKYEPIAVRAKQPNGDSKQVYTVSFTQRGLLNDISCGGWGQLIDRFAWSGFLVSRKDWGGIKESDADGLELTDAEH